MRLYSLKDNLLLLSILIIVFHLFYSSNHSFFKVRLSGAFQALEQWTRERAYPENYVSDEKYYKAFSELSTNKLEKLSLSNNAERFPIGPYNIGGRTLSVAINPINPNIIYAGSASGGLWKSYSGGVGAKAWEYVNTDFPVLSVSSIVIDETDTNTIYIGTGEVYGYQNTSGGLVIRTTRGSYGLGILKTTNNGVTWSKSLDWSYEQSRGVQVIKMHPVNNQILYAATTEGLFKTTDAGKNWVSVLNVIMMNDLIINTNNPENIVVSAGNLSTQGKGIYKTSNGGVSWQKIETGVPSDFSGKIHFSNFTGSDTIYASVGKGFVTGAGTVLLKSTDFGSTWIQVNNTDYATYQGWYSHFVVNNPLRINELLCAGIDIYKSTNGGLNLEIKSDWSAWYFGNVPAGGPEGPDNYSHADHHGYAIHPNNPDIVYFATDGGIFRTTNFGETFSGCNGGYQTTQFYKRFSVSGSDSLFAIGGMQDNATAFWEGTTDWRRVIGGDGCCTQINPTNSNIVYGSYQYLRILRSTNKGYTWNGLSLSVSDASFNGPFLLSPSQPNIIYAGGTRLYKSTNSGSTWTAMNSNQAIDGQQILSIAVSYTNPDTLYLTTAPITSRAGVFKSTNGGNSWINISSSLPDRYPVDISVDPNNSAIVYVAFSGFGIPHLWKSADGGNTWINISEGLPDVPTSAIAIDPLHPNEIYAGNDLGLFYSSNSGNNWRNLNINNRAVIVMDLAISSIKRKLFIATHGSGVFTFNMDDISAINEKGKKTEPDFELLQNYPNPFNSATKFLVKLKFSENLKISIYDINGKLVKIIHDHFLSSGNHEINFESNEISTGIYFCRFENSKISKTIKLVLIK